MNEIKNSMILDKDDLRKREAKDEIIKTSHIAQISDSSTKKKSNAITDDYLKAVEASIDAQ